MEQKIIRGLKAAKAAFPEVSFIVFGSHARGNNRKDSDLDVCALFPEIRKDPFDLAFEVRTEIHKYLDMAIDVIICDQNLYSRRKNEQWSMEYSINREGITV